MKNRISQVLVILVAIFIIIISLRPSLIWASEQKLLRMVQSTSPFYYNILINGNKQHLNQVVRTNDHVFILNSVHWNNDKNIVRLVHSTQTPSLTVFGDAIEQSKSVGAIHLVDGTGFEYKPIHGSTLGFATDVVDTVSWLTCFENVPIDIGDFKLIMGQIDIPDDPAEFTITITK